MAARDVLPGMWRFTLGLVACLFLLLGACSASGTSATDAVRRVQEQDPRFAGIEARDPNAIGQADWYALEETADGWQVTMRIGWGDCPAGCSNEHRWIYLVHHDGSVQLGSEAGDPLPSGGGISGTLTAGPTCPVQRQPPDPACAERPVAGAHVRVTRPDGVLVATVTADVAGHFTLELAPGTYVVAPQPVEGLMGTPAEQDVTVAADGSMAEVSFSYDTGIR